MTDDLLGQATRLADNSPDVGVGPLLRALVERVRDAEQGRDETFKLWQRASMSVLRLTDERDEARGKLDAVREIVTNPPVFGDIAPARWYGQSDMQRDVLAILDGR